MAILTAPLELRESGPRALPSRFTASVSAPEGTRLDKVRVPLHLLADSDKRQVIGVVEAVRPIGNVVLLTGKLHSDLKGSEAERIARLASRGSPHFIKVLVLHGQIRAAVVSGFDDDGAAPAQLFTDGRPKPKVDTRAIYDRLNNPEPAPWP
jgi:hypothetical protein